MILTELLYVAVVPLVTAGTVAIVARPLRIGAPALWPTCVALAYMAGQLGLASRTGNMFASFFQPREAADWLPLAVLWALGVTILAELAPRPWNRIALILAVTLTIALPLRLLAGSAYDLEWTLFEKLAHIALLSATLGLTWLMLAAAHESDHPRIRPLLLIIVACGAAVVVARSGVFVYGELGGVVAAALTGTLLATPKPHLAGAAGVVACSLGCLILLSCFYAELTPMNAALLFSSMMLAAGPMPNSLATRQNWQKTALRLVLTLLPLAIAVFQTLAAARAQTSPDPYWQ